MEESAVCKTDTKEIDFRLWRYLDHTGYMIFRAREKELARVGLTPEKSYVLDILDAAGGATSINRIVQATQRQHNSISTLIARMAGEKLVRRTRSRRDKRVYRIALTEKGRSLFNAAPRNSVSQAFQCLSLEEKQKMVGYLDRLLVHAYESAGQTYEPVVPEMG